MQLTDRYDSVRVLGSGGAGTVYLVRDHAVGGRLLALKVFHADLSAAAIAKEARILSRLYHPNVVPILETGTLPDGRAYLTSPYIDGDSLVAALSGKSLVQIARVLSHVALTLDAVHEAGVCHLDLKPENILLSRDGSDAVKLLDFGFSQRVTATTHRATQAPASRPLSGTLAYMAPERLLHQRVDHRADFYSLGIIVYQLVYGTLPFAADDPEAVLAFHLSGALALPPHPPVPAYMQSLMSQCLANSPAARFSRGRDIDGFLVEHAGLTLDLSTYGPLSTVYRERLAAEVNTFIAQMEANLNKPNGPVAGVIWTEQLQHLKRYQSALDHAASSAKATRRVTALQDKIRYLEARVQIEKGDYRAVLRLSRQTPDDANAHGLAHFYLGEYLEAATCFKAAGAAAKTALARGSADNYLGMTAYAQGEYAEAAVYYTKSEAQFKKLGQGQPLVSLYLNQGALFQIERRYDRALAAYEKSLSYARQIDHPYLVATLLNNLANLYISFGAAQDAELFWRESQAIATRHQIPYLLAYNTLIAGDLAFLTEDTDASEACYHQAHAQFEALGMDREAAIAQSNLFDLFYAGGALDKAKTVASTPAHQLILDLEADKRRAVPSAGDPGVALAHCAYEERRGKRREALAALAPALARHSELRQAVPHAYRPHVDRHPLWRRLLAKREMLTAALSQGDDPVKLNRFKGLLEVNKKLNLEHRLDVLLAFVMDTVIELSQAERGFLMLLSETEKATATQKRLPFRITVARNMDQETVRHSAGKISRTVAEKVLQSGKALLTSDAAADPRLKSAHSVHGLKLKSILCVPLLHRGQVEGAIYLENRFQKGVFTADDEELLCAFAEQAAIALINARLYEENVRHSQAIQSLNDKLKDMVADQQIEIDVANRALVTKQAALERRYRYDAIIGESPALSQVLDLLDRLSDRDISVLITGESGTGKELAARALHFNGPRKAREFVAINCAAIPADLLESELFGYVRGAFTGAERDKAGLFELAHGGTLFLDEIGDMPMAMQAKLLRVLQERELHRVGSNRKIAIDVRVVSATNKALLALAKQKLFREDLYYRLNGMTLALPPLRERREDIPLLVRHLLKKCAPDRRVRLAPAAMTALLHYSWPGNIRELANELERACVLADDEITPALLSDKVVGDWSVTAPAPHDLRANRGELDRALIRRALEAAGGNKSKAARHLGLSRVALYQKIKKLGLAKAGTDLAPS